MINLLPSDSKQNYSYARRNTKLLRWASVLLASIAGVGIIVAFGLFYMNQSINDYTVQNAKIQQDLKDQKLEETQKNVQDISSSLKLVVKVLSKEVLFSKLIKQIGTAIPTNAVLTDLEISKTQGGIDLTAIAADYNTATQVQVNLKDPANKIFDKADILNITCSTAQAANKKYPCSISIRAQFAKSNPFLFISPTTGSKS